MSNNKDDHLNLKEILKEPERYTVTVSLSLEPGRLDPQLSSFTTDTHTVLTGQCPLSRVEDLDLPALLAASEPVKVTWDGKEGTRIENISVFHLYSIIKLYNYFNCVSDILVWVHIRTLLVLQTNKGKL